MDHGRDALKSFGQRGVDVVVGVVEGHISELLQDYGDWLPDCRSCVKASQAAKLISDAARGFME